MSERSIGPVRTAALAWAFFFALAATVYFSALHGPFFFDDIEYLVDSPLIRSPHALWHIWFSRDAQDYWPLTYTLFRGEWLCFGMNPLGYHLVNLAIHALSCTLLWRVIARLRLPSPFVVATLFCVHPINAEAVAWIFQAKTTLAAALVLAATLAYLRSRQGDGRADYLASLGLFVLANLAKISVVAWPIVFLGYEWYREGCSLKRRTLLRTAPFFAISGALGLLNVSWYGDATRELVMPGLAARLAGAGQIFGFYLGKSLLPIGLTLLYPRWTIDPSRWIQWLPSAVLLGAIALFLFSARARRRWAGAMLLLGYLLATLLPVLGFVPFEHMAISWVTDHYFYLGSAGLIAGGVAWASPRLQRLLGETWSRQRAVLAFAVPALVLFCVLSAGRAAVFGDAETLWKDTLAKNPSTWVAHHDLGVTLAAKGKIDEAIAQYSEALKLKPDHAEAYYGIGVALLSKGETGEAVGEFEQALRLRPDYEQAHLNLGAVLASNGDLAGAITHFQKAVAIAPEDASAQNNLGALLAAQGKTDEAIARYSEALRLNPNYPDAHNNLGGALLGLGRTREAIAHFIEAVEIEPSDAQAHANLGTAYLNAGNPAAAIQEYRILANLNSTLAKTLYDRIAKSQSAS